MTRWSQEDAELQQPETSHGEGAGAAPEPPSRWQPDDPGAEPPQSTSAPQSGFEGFRLDIALSDGSTMPLVGWEAAEFNSGRKFITAAQIMAIASLFIGGVVLATAAIIVAVIGKRKINAVLASKGVSSDARVVFDRAVKVAVGMSVLALILNAATLVLMYPTYMEILQSGNFSNMFQQAPQNANPTSPSGSLFG